MDGEVTEAGRRALDHLTAIKLALQSLERRADLTADQRRPVATALGASDEVAAGLLAGAPLFRPEADAAGPGSRIPLDGALPAGEDLTRAQSYVGGRHGGASGARSSAT